MIEIRSRSDSSCVLYRSETAETIRAAVVEAVAAGADLADAYREVRTENDPSPPVKCINDPCDCGLDAALKALEGEP